MSFALSGDSQPIYHRADIAHIMNALESGNSCAIIGISNIGKSHLLRSLRRPDVQREFLGAQRDDYIIIYVDFNLMWEMSDQGFYEVILRGITAPPASGDTLADAVTTLEDVTASLRKLAGKDG